MRGVAAEVAHPEYTARSTDVTRIIVVRRSLVIGNVFRCKSRQLQGIHGVARADNGMMLWSVSGVVPRRLDMRLIPGGGPLARRLCGILHRSKEHGGDVSGLRVYRARAHTHQITVRDFKGRRRRFVTVDDADGANVREFDERLRAGHGRMLKASTHRTDRPRRVGRRAISTAIRNLDPSEFRDKQMAI